MVRRLTPVLSVACMIVGAPLVVIGIVGCGFFLLMASIPDMQSQTDAAGEAVTLCLCLVLGGLLLSYWGRRQWQQRNGTYGGLRYCRRCGSGLRGCAKTCGLCGTDQE